MSFIYRVPLLIEFRAANSFLLIHVDLEKRYRFRCFEMIQERENMQTERKKNDENNGKINRWSHNTNGENEKKKKNKKETEKEQKERTNHRTNEQKLKVKGTALHSCFVPVFFSRKKSTLISLFFLMQNFTHVH